MLAFVTKILGWIITLNVLVLPFLWIFEILYLFTIILVYEASFILLIGILQILSSYIYKENSIPYRFGSRTGWWDFKKFARLKPEERHRYRQEGKIMVAIGLALLFGTLPAHFYILVFLSN